MGVVSEGADQPALETLVLAVCAFHGTGAWVTLRARWVTLRARWVTLRARWVTR
jgi:hypothetical protein